MFLIIEFDFECINSVIFFMSGFGLFATKNISHGDFIVEYAGKVVSAEIGDNIDDQTYVYHFELQGQRYW